MTSCDYSSANLSQLERMEALVQQKTNFDGGIPTSVSRPRRNYQMAKGCLMDVSKGFVWKEYWPHLEVLKQ
jgi:hypothetical protein